MTAWRLATSLEVLRQEVNNAWPFRSRASDGTIGDAAHASTGSASDHNPWVIDANGVGVVRAFDITADGVPADELAEFFRKLGASGDERLGDTGYVIWDHKIASIRNAWAWRPYDGADPHTSHIHLSVTQSAPDYDSQAPWGVASVKPAPPAPTPEDDDVKHVLYWNGNAYGPNENMEIHDIAYDPPRSLGHGEAAMLRAQDLIDHAGALGPFPDEHGLVVALGGMRS